LAWQIRLSTICKNGLCNTHSEGVCDFSSAKQQITLKINLLFPFFFPQEVVIEFENDFEL